MRFNFVLFSSVLKNNFLLNQGASYMNRESARCTIKPVLLTGDTPTGQLHLGHWAGSLENRVKLQQTHTCFFIIANAHAFTTKLKKPQEIRDSVMQITLDYLAAGIDPEKSSIFVQTEVPAIAELSFLFSMLVSYSRITRNPTIKSEIKDKNLTDNYPFGFLLYPIGQVADILAFRPQLIPVGEDQLPHIEMTREVARTFNALYCHVPPGTPPEKQIEQGGLFPIPDPLIGKAKRLVGITPPDGEGNFKKMSKSLNNAIFIADDPDVIRKKVKKIYTDPARISQSIPGKIENNPLWMFLDVFCTDPQWLENAKNRYKQGAITDRECKERLTDEIIALTEPMRRRRAEYQKHPDAVLEVLKMGTKRANEVAEETLSLVKKATFQDFFSRQINISSL